MNFQQRINKIDQNQWQPQFFALANQADKVELETLTARYPELEIIDSLSEAMEDLFKIDFPFIAPTSPEYQKSFQRYQERYRGDQDWLEKGVWAYFPWRQVVVHLPEAADYLKLRTARNKFLITAEEQSAFYQARIGIGGLSVGLSALNALVLSGGAGKLRLADFDTLAITNLNRLPSSVTDLGRKKAISAARKTMEINPFQEIDLFLDGLNADNMNDFFSKDGENLDLYIEAMDDIKLKIDSRFQARQLRIPVLMVTDNGDNTIIDIERFDLEADRPLFHGTIDEQILRSVPEKPSQAQKVKLASKIVGSDITPRTQYSLTQVGTKLPSWPQLGNAALLSGVAASYVARRILTGQNMPSGRYEINLDAHLDPEYQSEAARSDRAARTADFIQALELLFGKD